MTLTKNATVTKLMGVFILKNHSSDYLNLIHCEDSVIVEVKESMMPDFQASSAIYLRTSAHGLYQMCMGKGKGKVVLYV